MNKGKGGGGTLLAMMSLTSLLSPKEVSQLVQQSALGRALDCIDYKNMRECEREERELNTLRSTFC